MLSACAQQHGADGLRISRQILGRVSSRSADGEVHAADADADTAAAGGEMDEASDNVG